MHEEKTKLIGENLDRIATLDLGARGVVYKLYEAARKLVDEPLTLTATRQIMKNVTSDDVVLFTTGFIVPPLRVQETDGPLGAVALARILQTVFHIKPLFLIEEQSKRILAATLNGLGMNYIENAQKTKSKTLPEILGFPVNLKDAREKAKAILDQYKPSVLLAIEKAGRNRKGEYHTMSGHNVTEFHAKIDLLFEEARKRDVLTVGIGDGGNEIGMGNIEHIVRKTVPFADLCQCPCKGGLAATTPVDILVVSSVSNWGSYGIEACLAHLIQKPHLFHTTTHEKSMLKSTVTAGAIDGQTNRAELSVDRIPLSQHLSLLKLFKIVIGN